MSRDDLPPSEWARYDTSDQPEPDSWDVSAERCVRHGYDGCDCYVPPPAATVTIHTGADQ